MDNYTLTNQAYQQTGSTTQTAYVTEPVYATSSSPVDYQGNSTGTIIGYTLTTTTHWKYAPAIQDLITWYLKHPAGWTTNAQWESSGNGTSFTINSGLGYQGLRNIYCYNRFVLSRNSALPCQGGITHLEFDARHPDGSFLASDEMRSGIAPGIDVDCIADHRHEF